MNLSIPTDDEAAAVQRRLGAVGIAIGTGDNNQGHCGANEGLEQEDRENASSWKRRKMNPSCDESMDTGESSSSSTSSTSTTSCAAADEMDDRAMDFASSNTSRGKDPFGAVDVAHFPTGSIGTHSNAMTRMNTFSQPPPRRNSSREYCYYCSCYYCTCQDIALGQNRVYTSA